MPFNHRLRKVTSTNPHRRPALAYAHGSDCYNPLMLSIALIIEHFDSSRGGAEHLTHWLAGQLAAAGITVHVVCHDVGHRINRYRAATQRASHDRDRSHAAHITESD